MPTTGRLAGIDFGTKRIGVAITDPDRRIASPYENLSRREPAEEVKWFRDFVEKERVVGFVVGLPVHTSGHESESSQRARDFGRWLSETTSRPVCFYDERYSSVEAEAILGEAKLTKKRRKQRLDMLAAQIVLSDFLQASAVPTESPTALEDEDHRS